MQLQIENITFITGNQGKLERVRHYLDFPIKHHELDLPEIQSLDLREITEAKVKSAFAKLGTPVLVEDVSLELMGLKGLPGPLIKWFLKTVGPDGLIEMADMCGNREVVATICFALYDGSEPHFFEGVTNGMVPTEPYPDDFGWNGIFVPDGCDRTFAEMTLDEQESYNMRAKALVKLKAFLQ